MRTAVGESPTYFAHFSHWTHPAHQAHHMFTSLDKGFDRKSLLSHSLQIKSSSIQFATGGICISCKTVETSSCGYSPLNSTHDSLGRKIRYKYINAKAKECPLFLPASLKSALRQSTGYDLHTDKLNCLEHPSSRCLYRSFVSMVP